jgi:hypothetical protein
MVSQSLTAQSSRSIAPFVAALTILSAATVVMTLVGDGQIVVAIAPLALLAGVWIIWTAPLRNTLFVLLFAGLSLDRPTDTNGQWHSPFVSLGALLMDNLNKTVPVEAMKISLLVLLIGLLLVIVLVRRSSGDSASEFNSIRPARPLLSAVVRSAAAALVMCGYGLARGGDAQMCKIQLQVFLPLLAMAYLFAISLRGVRDYKTLQNLIIAAACVKAVEALWIRLTLPIAFGDGRGEQSYATCHGDSMLFSCAFTIIAASFFERPRGWRVRWAALALLIIMGGTWANDRRLAWVQMAMSVGLLVAMNWRGRVVRRTARVALCFAPLFLVYVAAGWNSESKVFAPVHTIRSVVDGDSNRSTWYRDAENYDLIATFGANPLMGTGFGHPFEQPLVLDSLPGFKEWQYLPHNSILGLWAFVGAVGFTGIWSVFGIGLMLAARSYSRLTSPDLRVAASLAMGSLVAYTIHCWGDIGFTEAKSIFLVGAGLALAGQLAASSRAWPTVTA